MVKLLNELNNQIEEAKTKSYAEGMNDLVDRVFRVKAELGKQTQHSHFHREENSKEKKETLTRLSEYETTYKILKEITNG